MKQQWEPPELEEMPMVILSLHQKWWQKMAAGEKSSGTAEDKATMQSTIPGAGVCHRRRGNSW